MSVGNRVIHNLGSCSRLEERIISVFLHEIVKTKQMAVTRKRRVKHTQKN